jgi:hypothetical protein
MAIDLTDTSDARISADDVVGGGFETPLSEAEVAEHVGTAHGVVEDELTGNGMTEQRLARIELYVARHLIRVEPNRQVDSETAGPMNRSYSGDYSRAFYESTAPGQQALMLDSSNTLGRETMDDFFAVG